MSEFTVALGMIAPYYNLAFAIIVFFLFVKLFSVKHKNKSIYITPWYLLFAGLLIFMLEEALTVLREVGAIVIPRHINGFFELVIISLFIHALFLQKDFLKRTFSKAKKK